MLDLAISVLRVAGHTIIIYLFLIVVIRRFGMRQFAQVTTVEFAIVAVLGSAVETAMVAGNTTLPAGLVSAGTLLLANRGLTEMVGRSNWLRQIVIGGPVLLVHNGEVIRSHLRDVGFSDEDLLAAMRKRGYDDLAKVRFAVLEIDGSIAVVPVDQKVHQGTIAAANARGSGSPVNATSRKPTGDYQQPPGEDEHRA